MNIFPIVLNDFRILWKSKVTLICFILIPPIFILIFAKIMTPVFGINSFIKPFSIAVVDYDKSLGSRMATTSLESEGYISKLVAVEYIEESLALERLKHGQLAGVVIIPKGFTNSLYLGSNKPVKVYISTQQGISGQIVKSFFSSAGDMVIAGQSGIYTIYHFLVRADIGNEEAYKRTQNAMSKLILTAMGRNEIFEKEVVSDVPTVNPLQYYIIGVSVMFMMYLGIIGVRLITQDYETGILTRIYVSPVTKFSYISAKLVTIISLGILEFISIVLPLVCIFKINFSINFALMITVIAIIFSSTALCVLITLWSKTSANATVACVISIFVISLVGGCIYPVASMADFLKYISKFVLSSWAIEGISLAVMGGVFAKVMNINLIIFVFGLVFIAISLITVQRRELKFF